MCINWAPRPEEELAQNVRTLLATEPGSVPLARGLGTPQDVIDTPSSAAAARLQAAVYQAVRTYEPRVGVQRVTLTADADGRLRAAVEIGAP